MVHFLRTELEALRRAGLSLSCLLILVGSNGLAGVGLLGEAAVAVFSSPRVRALLLELAELGLLSPLTANDRWAELVTEGAEATVDALDQHFDDEAMFERFALPIRF